MATQAERKEQTKRRLIDAAARLFQTHGFDQVSVNQIVEAANVAKGTFYQYYETKVDILADVTRDEGAEKIKEALEAVRQGASALAVLERFLKAQCDWFEGHEKVAEALIMGALKSVGLDQGADKLRYSRHFQATLMELGQQQGEVRSDIDPREIAKMIGGAVVVSVLAWSKNPQPNTLYPSVQQSLKILLEGIRPHQGDAK